MRIIAVGLFLMSSVAILVLYVWVVNPAYVLLELDLGNHRKAIVTAIDSDHSASLFVEVRQGAEIVVNKTRVGSTGSDFDPRAVNALVLRQGKLVGLYYESNNERLFMMIDFESGSYWPYNDSFGGEPWVRQTKVAERLIQAIRSETGSPKLTYDSFSTVASPSEPRPDALFEEAQEAPNGKILIIN